MNIFICAGQTYPKTGQTVVVHYTVSPIQYNQFQKPISLAKGSLSHVLQKMNQVMVAKSTCQERHYNVRLTGSHLCTLNRYEIGTCAGDSDGSLICNGAQYGVISYGFPCAQSLTSILISISISINLLIMPKKTSRGDSGGPLISNGVQIGITSWVAPCAQGYSDVYTDVFHYSTFINNAEKEAECEIQDAPSANHSRKELDEFDLIYGRKLCSPILGYNCQLPDLPTSSIPSTTLDTSLLHIPIYAHLKIYSLEPVRLPEPPSILSSLQLQFSEGTILSKSSREISLTARLSEENGIFASCSARNSKKLRMLNKE
ncbi:Chymotrypsin-1 [Trachymyrmex zeteki]|uniref:Chymotrypsin-1 n=1 Tax=Mycetomoellerius zeteki TaxID=64791 RepID=A0A151XGH6_9HYME|nr:Chymotrypsin-1 [Trachymyrmex zeteki]